ncbi:MAG: S-ribosylhomocysteine lyase [Bacteroidaceae bacterium]|jgi:S-ribosylhomocysteine lyase|uniref:S-ribosylhomocysteine lyase n=1 Tax=unclassified Bacteroides TaxID=2646097 RepID=UPI00054E81C6|nr:MULTISPECIES: S-ribosylhomocysteine lyase [unclassified Bacteroides]MBP3244731.1 S-ribosylhomocysteine lyase [Bacteroidaceae bacterium]MBP5219102.1 S-ribosylhomocysteine lyase [Bacteroidaceae bacterium]MBQ1676929.1 S-ribosylhomocysteine lyase [Bacteroidaceae bacterium]MBQ2055688.1 S-ribosylhomocysteine lyase [Bacteroidaceae bacterium]MBQ3770852.1 S-ribosylhomocysteine lyase [Bacteroidaceae bacterium]
METIPSFAVDHTNLRPGIYISRQDSVGDEFITTYDIRMTGPNQEPALAPAAIHTIEHIVATYLRNNDEWKDNVIYWGPMGCLTGNYLILKGNYPCEQIRSLMIEAFQYVADYDDNQNAVPGTTAATCGNYLMHDLPMAKWEAKRYVQRLKNEFCCVYPGVERPTDNNGLQFFDA